MTQLLWSRLLAATGGLCAFAAIGCENPLAPPIALPDVREWVTGVAASSLDAEGHYVFPQPGISTPFPEIDEARARVLAAAFLKTFASSPGFASRLNAQHGRDIPFQDIRIAERLEFAETPYEPVPADTSPATRRFLGAFFVARALYGNTPAVSVAVSVHASDLDVEDGILVFPAASGNEFASTGMPVQTGHAYPTSPERATEFAARLTGARVAELPRLILPERRDGYEFARWQLVFDRQVTVVDVETGKPYASDTLFIGVTCSPACVSLALFVATPEQPTVDTLPGSVLRMYTVKADVPIRYREVMR